MNRRLKIAFFCENGDTKFLVDIMASLRVQHEVSLHRKVSDSEMRRILSESDLAWMEWCNGQVVQASTDKPPCPVICRLHRNEAYADGGWPTKVRWKNIAALVFIGNRFVRDKVVETVPDLFDQTRVCGIPPGIDTERFRPREKPNGKRLGWVGYLHERKNPKFLLECFAALLKRDPSFTLHVAGAVEDAALADECVRTMNDRGFADKVSWCGWIPDIAAWMADKDYIVSTSTNEGAHNVVMEGMACGLQPLVYDWPGARDFYPYESIFTTPDEFARLALESPHNPLAHRDYAASRYGIAVQMRLINALIESLAEPPERRPPDSDATWYDGLWSSDSALECWWRRTRREKVCGGLETMGRKPLRILDLGCGPGTIESHLVPFGPVHAVDWSKTAIAKAKYFCNAPTYEAGNFFGLDLPKNHFDAVTSMEVIEHLVDADQPRYMALVRDVLKPGGRLFLTCPNATVMRPFDENYKKTRGRPWSMQPIENWPDKDRLMALVVGAGLTVLDYDCVIESDGFKGLHQYLAAEKPKEKGA